MKHVLAAIIVILLGCSICYSAETVDIAVDQENPPFMYAKNGQAAGLYPTLVESVFKRMNIPVSIKPLPWKRAQILADKGETGIAGIYKNKERIAKYEYSDEIFQEKLILFVLKGHEFPYKKIDDLAGKKIGVIRGWSYGDDFDTARKKEAFKVEEVAGDDQNFKKLLNGRIDCLVAIEETGRSFLAQAPFKGKIAELSTPVAVNPTYLIFQKKAKAAELLPTFNTTLSKMKKDGEYTKLVQNFFSQK
jgi:polar amino acid transport system substrate-binding protein